MIGQRYAQGRWPYAPLRENANVGVIHHLPAEKHFGAQPRCTAICEKKRGVIYLSGELALRRQVVTIRKQLLACTFLKECAGYTKDVDGARLEAIASVRAIPMPLYWDENRETERLPTISGRPVRLMGPRKPALMPCPVTLLATFALFGSLPAIVEQ
jgi:hypothetical protein